MQEFLSKDKVSYNLMSLTGYRTLVLFNLILSKPSTIEEINNYFLQNKYIKDSFSKDMLRVYINSLKAVGCTITRPSKTNNYTYKIISHPFGLKLNDNSLKIIYERIFPSLNFNEIIIFEKLFLKLLANVRDEYSVKILSNILKLQSFDPKLIIDLVNIVKTNKTINLTYNSANSKIKTIDFTPDKIGFQNDKLYIWGFNFEYNDYGYLKVDKILRINNINLFNNLENNPQKVKLKISKNDFIATKELTITKEYDNFFISEIEYQNKFELIQNILSLGEACTVLEPANIKQEIITKIQQMRTCYD